MKDWEKEMEVILWSWSLIKQKKSVKLKVMILSHLKTDGIGTFEEANLNFPSKNYSLKCKNSVLQQQLIYRNKPKCLW